ncbi:MAG: NUDIX hydrolase [Acidimicrobiales bacterium]
MGCGSEQERSRRLAPRDLASVLDAVRAHTPGDRREQEARERILDASERLEDPFDEHSDPVHFTGSAVVVGARGTVLHVHKRLGRWLQPGGHLEPGEAPFDAAVRESREETGLRVSHPAEGPRLIHVDVHPAAASHVHLDMRYLLLAPDDQPSPSPGESRTVRWFTWDEADALCDDALAGALRVARYQPEVRQYSMP